MLAAAALLVAAPTAHARISEATVVDSSADIVGVDGVAMAEDGTGGMVFRKRVGGRPKVFVAQFAGGEWRAPQRVDTGQNFTSSWPAIGAANGGRLVVTWSHEFNAGAQNRMYSAVLDAGAKRFQAPVAFDLDVRDGLDLQPSLSMTPGGVAYLAYRVVFARQDPGLPPGYIDADIRLARLQGTYWSVLGQPVDRVQTQPQRAATPFNGPKVATTLDGNAVVVWQEPDDAFNDRVFARRVFGSALGNVLTASPTAVGDVPVRGTPDQFALDVARFGETSVVVRQQPAGADRWRRARLLVNMLPASATEGAGAFLGPRPIDGGGDDGPAANLGPASTAVDDDGNFSAGFGVDTASVLAGGTETTLDPSSRLDDGANEIPGDPLLDRGTNGEIAAAYRVGFASSGAVGLLERRADGTPVQQVVAAPAGGAVADLRLGGSGLGDALVAWRQGQAVTAAVVDAPPGAFAVAAPLGFQRAKTVELRWGTAPNGVGRPVYELQIDGEPVATGLRRTRAVVETADVEDGRHDVAVVAKDPSGQETTSAEAVLSIDRTAPTVRTRISKGRYEVRTSDGVRDESSGVASVRISWGDGTRGRGTTARHRFKRRGRFRVVIRTKDKAGNARTVRRTVIAR
jgi:hypothetical protein